MIALSFLRMRSALNSFLSRTREVSKGQEKIPQNLTEELFRNLSLLINKPCVENMSMEGADDRRV